MIFLKDTTDAIAATHPTSVALVATPDFSRFELMRLGDDRSSTEIEELGRQWGEQGFSFAGCIGTGAVPGGEVHIALTRPAPVEQLRKIEAAFHQLIQPPPVTGDEVLFLERLWLESEDPR